MLVNKYDFLHWFGLINYSKSTINTIMEFIYIIYTMKKVNIFIINII